MPTWLIWTLGLGIPAAAAAVPIIIHLINLTRYRKVDWAAMEFLLAAYRKTRRRLRMESLIMLLLRVAAIILIAAALFPMGCEQLKAWADGALGFDRGTLSTDAPLHLVIVFDNSASTGYRQENQTSLDRAKQFALSTVDSLQPNRDRVSIVRMSDIYIAPDAGGAEVSEDDAERARRRRVGQLASLNLEAARREIAATNTAAVDTNMLAALREAARMVENTPASDAVALLVISDYTNSGWREISAGATVNADFVATMDRMRARMSESGTTPIFYDAGFDSTANVAISNVRGEERVIGNGMQARVLVDVEHFSSDAGAPSRSVRLKYRIDGGADRPFPTPPIGLGANERREAIELLLPPGELALQGDELRTGASRNIEIFTEDPDALVVDNSRHFVIHVVPGVPILVVNGVLHADVKLDETFYLETALGISSSYIEEEGRRGEEVRITPNQIVSKRPQDLATIDSFFDYRLVILANVREVPEAVVGKLEEFVEAGYGLLIFDGPQVDHGLYNSLLYKDGKGLLPAKLGRPGGAEGPAAETFGLAIGDGDHPVMRLFTSSPEHISIVTEPQAVFNWREVTLPEGTEADPKRPARTLINLNLPTGPTPMLIERPFGRGSVMYSATTASERWHGLWGTNGLPIFLYLEAASYLTGNEARYSNLRVGEPYRRVLRVADIAPRFTVRDPAGTTMDVVPTAEQGLNLLEFAGTSQPGVYTVSALERTETGESRRRWQERFSVNLSSRESDVTRMSVPDSEAAEATTGVEAALKAALGDMPLLYRRAGEDMTGAGALTGDKGGREWMWLAALGVAFLLFETLWSGVISKPES